MDVDSIAVGKQVRLLGYRGEQMFGGERSVIRMAPTLITSQRELELGLDTLEESLREVSKRCR